MDKPPPNLKLIGITGKKQSGKDSVSTFIHEVLSTRYDFTRIGFADELKIEASVLLGISVPHLNRIKNIPEIRQLLQRLGTEKRSVNLDYWIKKLEAKIPAGRDNLVICIPDVRYLNEAAWIKSRGGILIRVERMSTDASGNYIFRDDGDTHSSEVEQDKIDVTCTIRNTSTLTKLRWESICCFEIIKQVLKI